MQYVHAFQDRHGKFRHYYRRAGRRVALPGNPGSAEFMEAYQAALAGASNVSQNIGSNRTKAGTVNAVIVAYYVIRNFTEMPAVS